MKGYYMKVLQFMAGAAAFLTIGFVISYSAITLLTELMVRLS